jgi:holo-[acyl-carrier protein] synthase
MNSSEKTNILCFQIETADKDSNDDSTGCGGIFRKDKVMMLGIGTDIICINRIKTLIDNPKDSFFQKTYTNSELERGFRNASPEIFLAGRFAAKEAIFKCFCMDGNLIRWNEIEILPDQWGVPRVTLTGMMKKRFQEMNATDVRVSISYEKEYAVSFAVVY